MLSRSRSRFTAVATTGLLLFAAVGCSSTEGGGEASTKISVGNYPNSSLSLPLEIAIKKGFFDNEGIEVEQIQAKSGAELIPALVSGSTQVSLATPEGTFPAIKQGEDLRTFGPYMKLEYVTLAQKSSGITSVDQLKGKKIGIGSFGGTAEMFTKGIMSEAGIGPKDVEFFALGNPVTMQASFANDRVDALTSTLATQASMEQAGIDFNVVASTVDGTGGEYGDYGIGSMWVTSASFKKEQPETFGKFCRALDSSIEWLADDANKDDAVQVMSEYLKLDKEIAAEVWKDERGMYLANVDQSRWTKNVQHVLGKDASLDRTKYSTACK